MHSCLICAIGVTCQCVPMFVHVLLTVRVSWCASVWTRVLVVVACGLVRHRHVPMVCAGRVCGRAAVRVFIQ
jgi:hypothetical protein